MRSLSTLRAVAVFVVVLGAPGVGHAAGATLLFDDPTFDTPGDGFSGFIERYSAVVPGCGVFTSQDAETNELSLSLLGSGAPMVTTPIPTNFGPMCTGGDAGIGQLNEFTVIGTDVQVTRVGPHSLLHLGVVQQNSDGGAACYTNADPEYQVGAWPEFNRTDDCGNDWSTPIVVTGLPTDPSMPANRPDLNWYHGFDANSMYADPFHVDSNGNATLYVTGGVCAEQNTSCLDASPVIRSTDGGSTWLTRGQIPLVEHGHMTTTPPQPGASNGMMFVFGCAGTGPETGVPTLFYSCDQGASFSVVQVSDAACPSPPIHGQRALNTTGITRISPKAPELGSDEVGVRVLYPAMDGNDFVLQVTNVAVPALCTADRDVVVKNLKQPRVMPVRAFKSIHTGGGLTLGSFIEPNGFDWFAAHPTLDLPDVAVLYWYDTSVPPARRTGTCIGDCAPPPYSDTVRFAVVRGWGEWSEPAPLAINSVTGNPMTWNPAGCDGFYGDVEDGSFWYDASHDRLNYFAVWPQCDTGGSFAHYNVVSISGGTGLVLKYPGPPLGLGGGGNRL